MKWLRWLPRLLTPGSMRAVPDPGAPRRGSRHANGANGAKSVGRCEACGKALAVHTKRANYRGRTECDCGHRNHVEIRLVRETRGEARRLVSVTRQRHFEAARREPDLRLSFRYGVCPHCDYAVRLIDAHVIARADTSGSVESSAYYCPTCHLHDDFRRGRLHGNDRKPIVDTLRY